MDKGRGILNKTLNKFKVKINTKNTKIMAVGKSKWKSTDIRIDKTRLEPVREFVLSGYSDKL